MKNLMQILRKIKLIKKIGVMEIIQMAKKIVK
jgi:hypothetical protein